MAGSDGICPCEIVGRAATQFAGVALATHVRLDMAGNCRVGSHYSTVSFQRTLNHGRAVNRTLTLVGVFYRNPSLRNRCASSPTEFFVGKRES